MSEFRYIGNDAPRPDAADKAAGRALYIHDLSRPGMLYGKIKFSEHAHARIKHIDTSRAERLPGVRAVITAYNTPEMRIGFLRDNFALKKGQGAAVPRRGRRGRRHRSGHRRRGRRADPRRVRAAAGGLHPRGGPGGGRAAGARARRRAAGPLSTNLLPRAGPPRVGRPRRGASAPRKYVVEGQFSTPLIQQTCMGTAGCIAEFDMRGNLTIWAKTQIPFLAQRTSCARSRPWASAAATPG